MNWFGRRLTKVGLQNHRREGSFLFEKRAPRLGDDLLFHTFHPLLCMRMTARGDEEEQFSSFTLSSSHTHTLSLLLFLSLYQYCYSINFILIYTIALHTTLLSFPSLFFLLILFPFASLLAAQVIIPR